MTYKTLPTEIIEQIFAELSIQDLLTCTTICHSWHIPAKREFYKHVQFKTSISINLFLSCIGSTTIETSLPSPGTFVKRLYFNHSSTTASVGSTLTAKHIQALAKTCPNVTVIDCTQNLNSCIVMGLLSLTDDIKWKNLTSFPDTKISQELYRQCTYKYRHSLSTLYFDMNDFSYLIEFPQLNILDLSSCPISFIHELDLILNSCKYLTQLTLCLEKRKQQQFKSTTTYPTLKLLKLTTKENEIDYDMIQYMINKFNRLLSVELCGIDLIDRKEYLMITKWINSMKSSELVLIGNDYNMIPEIATEYLFGIFSTQLNTIYYNTTLHIHNNKSTFLVYSTISNNPICIQRDIDIQLPEFETNNRFIHSNYIQQFSPFVNELFISYEGTPIYTRGCSYFLDGIIEQCTVLKSISVNYCDLSLSTNTINETITDFSISNSQISQDFFNSLSFSCPNLKYLTLHRNFHTRSQEHAIFISTPHSDLESLSLLGEIHFPWITTTNSNNIWMIKINTTRSQKTRYFKIDTTTSQFTEIFDKEQQKSRIIRRAGSITSISIGIHCKSLKKFRMTTSFTDVTLTL